MGPEPETVELLRRWHAGEQEALDALIARDLPWIRERVRQRLGPLLRARAETGDFVQEALLELLRYGPRFLLSNRAHFRALLARIVENVLRAQHDRFTAYKRAVARERPLPSESALALDGPRRSVALPSAEAEKEEWEGLVRLALELLEPADREVVLLREWDGLSFPDIGGKLEISADAARMRFNAAMGRLTRAVLGLTRGEVGELLGEGKGEGP